MLFFQYDNSNLQKGKTAVHLAIEYENLSQFKSLIDAGAILTLKDQMGNTPLHYCITGHRDDMLSLLVQEGF